MFLVTGVLKTFNLSTFKHFTSMKRWIFECKIKGIKKCRLMLVSFLQRAMILKNAYRNETEVK